MSLPFLFYFWCHPYFLPLLKNIGQQVMSICKSALSIISASFLSLWLLCCSLLLTTAPIDGQSDQCSYCALSGGCAATLWICLIRGVLSLATDTSVLIHSFIHSSSLPEPVTDWRSAEQCQWQSISSSSSRSTSVFPCVAIIKCTLSVLSQLSLCSLSSAIKAANFLTHDSNSHD